MNQMQAQAMERAGELCEPIFRAPCSVGSGEVLTDDQIDAALEAWFENGPVGIEHKTDRSRMRAAIAAATEGAES